MAVILGANGITYSDATTQQTAVGPVGTQSFAAPAAVGGTTANAGAFTTLTSQGSAVLSLANYNNAVVGGSATLTAGQRYFFNANTQTATLPASPAAGDTVTVGVQSGDTTSVVVRNGQNIMGLAQNMTIDIGNASVTLEYTNATFGWRII